jgi:hypothetical protein
MFTSPRLRGYVAALGGNLDVNAVFPDGSFTLESTPPCRIALEGGYSVLTEGELASHRRALDAGGLQEGAIEIDEGPRHGRGRAPAPFTLMTAVSVKDWLVRVARLDR